MEVLLLIGGNQGNRNKFLKGARERLSVKITIRAVSAIYESEAWGEVATANFLNQVLLCETELAPLDLLDFLQAVELALGRKRTDHWGDRTMDVDILYYGDRVLADERLSVPHPFIPERRFTLEPLTELLPHKVNPKTGLTHSEMLEKCPDKGKVWKYSAPPDLDH